MAGRPKASRVSGLVYRDNPVNAARFRDWFRCAVKDQVLFFWLLNTLTVLLFIIGALAVLRPKGLVPAPATLIWDEAGVLAEVWGPFGRTLFLVIGVATLFSTQLAILEGASRSVAEIWHTNFAWGRTRPSRFWHGVVSLLWMAAGCLLVYVLEKRGTTELGFLLNAAYMGGFAMAVYVPLLHVMNRRFLPTSARPGPLATAGSCAASLIYGGFALFCLWSEFSS